VKNLLFVLFICFFNTAKAAQVTYSNGISDGLSSSIVNPYEFESDEYNNFVEEYGIHSSMGNDGQELIYLSAENNHHTDNEIKELDVNIINTNGTSQNTESVSLVLSGGAKILWDITVDDSVSLKNIFLFGLTTQSVNFNGTPVEFIDDQLVSYVDEVGLFHSSVVICGTSLPQDGYQATCTTDALVGINSFQELFPGFSLQTNPNSIVNYLDDLVKEYTGDSLGITNFNGAQTVDSYNVEISTTAVPLPAGWILFSSAMAFLVVRRSSFY